jgi:L-ribulose-5-phosphate 4-epimerase
MADTDTLRDDVVTLTRLLVMQEILDYSGHVSARVPGQDALIIQPRDMSRAALSAPELLVIAFDGTVLQGDGVPVAEWPIHAGAYEARPDVAFVCHGHPTLSTTFTMIDGPVLPMRHFAYKNGAGLAVHPDPTHIVTMDQGRALARTLGDAGACLLRSHGTLVVAPRAQDLFMDCMDLEENARTQLYASQLGTPVPLTESELADIAASYGKLGHRANKMWEHYRYKGRLAGVL